MRSKYACWAAFVVVMRGAELDPLHATALVSNGSLVVYLPLYLAVRGFELIDVPLPDFALQAAFQSILVTIVSLVLFGRSVTLLGVSGGAAFGALVPALSAANKLRLLRDS